MTNNREMSPREVLIGEDIGRMVSFVSGGTKRFGKISQEGIDTVGVNIAGFGKPQKVVPVDRSDLKFPSRKV